MEQGTTERKFFIILPIRIPARFFMRFLNVKAGCSERLEPIPGHAPSLADPPAGCPFVTRCSFACQECRKEIPKMKQYSETQRGAVHFFFRNSWTNSGTRDKRQTERRAKIMTANETYLLEAVDVSKYFPVKNFFGRTTQVVQSSGSC